MRNRRVPDRASGGQCNATASRSDHGRYDVMKQRAIRRSCEMQTCDASKSSRAQSEACLFGVGSKRTGDRYSPRKSLNIMVLRINFGRWNLRHVRQRLRVDSLSRARKFHLPILNRKPPRTQKFRSRYLSPMDSDGSPMDSSTSAPPRDLATTTMIVLSHREGDEYSPSSVVDELFAGVRIAKQGPDLAARLQHLHVNFER